MPSFVSPGVYVLEKDISDYTPTVNPSVVGVVGFADKGEPNKATLITSQQQLINTFGRPNEDLPGQGIEGSLEMLETTNQLWYVRAMNTEGDGAGANATAAVRMGSCPAVMVKEGATVGDLYLRITVTDNDGVSQFPEGARTFTITGGLGTQAEKLRAVLGGALPTDHLGVHWTEGSAGEVVGSETTGLIATSYAGSGASLRIEAFSTNPLESTTPTPKDVLVGLDASGNPDTYEVVTPPPLPNGNGEDLQIAYSSDITIKGVTFTIGSLSYQIESLWQGAGYNQTLQANGQITGNAISASSSGGSKVTLSVFEDGSIKENYLVSLSLGSYVEEVINTGPEGAVSEVISGWLSQPSVGGDIDAQAIPFLSNVSLLGTSPPEPCADPTDPTDTCTGPISTVIGFGANMSEMEAGGAPMTAQSVNPRFAKFIEGGVGLTGGDSGVGTSIQGTTDSALVGHADEDPKTGLYALDYEFVPITMAIIPGFAGENVQNELVTLAEATGNFIAVLGTPIGIGNAQKAIDWHNGKSQLRNSSLNNSYAAIYYPSVKVFNSYFLKDIFMDAAVFGVRQMCFTDNVTESWFAPAGFSRGRLTKPTEVEVELSRGDRDALYSGGNAINPIVNFPQQGITIFGQRTAQREPTALDRINVRRLLLSVKRTILAATQRYVFEPNDEITWEKIKNTLDPFLDDIRRRRGITQFKVVCDETTNTPVRVDRNELWCKVLIKPTKSAEVIVFELNITNQSTNLSS